MGHAKRKTFRPWEPEQTTLLPASTRDWLAEVHQVYCHLVLVDELDLSEALIPAQAKDPRGEMGVDPRMMSMLLLYSYCVGIVLSGMIERARCEVLVFRVLSQGCLKVLNKAGFRPATRHRQKCRDVVHHGLQSGLNPPETGQAIHVQRDGSKSGHHAAAITPVTVLRRE